MVAGKRKVKLKKGAKQKVRKKRKPQGSPFSSFAFSARKLTVWLMLLLLATFAALYLNECSSYRQKFFPGGNVELSAPPDEAVSLKEGLAAGSFSDPEESQRSSLSLNPQDTGDPRLLTGRKEEIIRYEGYTVSYNVDYKLANWVFWELTSGEALSKQEERSGKFAPDPSLKGKTAMNEDYSRSGYDRGHLAPAGDMKWSMKSMQQSFYYSNIAPQNPRLNQGIWNNLENRCRQWAIAYDKVLIVAGPVLSNGMKRLGKNRIAVPGQFYKVICAVSGGKYEGIAYLLDNKDYKNTSLRSLAIPIDSVEKVTGIEFFPELPEEAMRRMKSAVDMSCWFD